MPVHKSQTIPKSNRKIIFLIFLAFFLCLVGCWVFWVAEYQYRFTPFLARTVGLSAMAIFGFSMIIMAGRLISKKPGIEITRDEIIDYSYKKLRIRWADIIELKTDETFGSEFILVMIRNPETYINRPDLIQKISMEWNWRTYGTPITLSSGSLKCTSKELYDLILKNWLNYRNENYNS